MLMMLPKSQRPKRPVWQWLRRRQRLAESAPPASRAGSALVAFLYRDNGLHRADIERIYRVGIRAAKHQIIIANAYFFPRSEEHTSELQSLMRISYAVFCLK